MSQTKAQLIDGQGEINLGGLDIDASAPDGSVNLDSSGRLLVGTSSARSNIYKGATALTPQHQIESSTNNYNNGLSLINYSGSGFAPLLNLGMSKSNTQGTNTLVADGSELGFLNFVGNDGTNFLTAAQIQVNIDGTPGANDMPGRLVFSTTADGASSPTERMRIKQNGDITIGKSSSSIQDAGIILQGDGYGGFTRSGNASGAFNRQTDDGVIINLLGQNVVEGTISVSGTTVSYNGAHLSRWSQLPGGATREEILRGTVLSNIDEMCEWGEEDNEQLNRMKVSDVEGDRNVSGVFQAWDDDDDTYTNDFYCAMTGDFIIRIAQGIVVQRGDLLMSTGDGTAKPQDDDIIRSKTIAKVTSTHVTCTYDDGSYCVPCVLMAC